MKHDISLRTVLAVAAAGLVLATGTACGGGSGTPDATQTNSPGDEGVIMTDVPNDPTDTDDPENPGTPAKPANPAPAPAGIDRCHTTTLKLTLGPQDAGAGQRHTPVILTNTGAKPCTIYGFPGVSLVDTASKPVAPDPVRNGEKAAKITVAPGKSAWATLSFSSPDVTGATSAEPSGIIVTPPDETVHLATFWQAGAVPASGNSSTIRVSPFRPGTGP